MMLVDAVVAAKLATGSVTSDALLAANVLTAAIADDATSAPPLHLEFTKTLDAITSAKITGFEIIYSTCCS